MCMDLHMWQCDVEEFSTNFRQSEDRGRFRGHGIQVEAGCCVVLCMYDGPYPRLVAWAHAHCRKLLHIL